MAESTGKFVILTRNGVADPGQEDAISLLNDRLRQPNAKLLIHLHGGLVSEEDGCRTARRLMGAGENSWNLNEEWTQLYIVWRTGAMETVRTNWVDLAQNDRLYQAVLRKLISFISRKLGVRVGSGSRSAFEVLALDEFEIHRRITGQGERHAPFADFDERLGVSAHAGGRAGVPTMQSDVMLADEFEFELSRDDRFVAAAAEVDGVVNEGAQGRSALPLVERTRGIASHQRLSESIRKEMEPPVAVNGARGISPVAVFLIKHAGKVARRCFQRFSKDRDHGLHATVVEELCREFYGDLIGATLWSMMVKDAAQHFEENGFGTTLVSLLAGNERIMPRIIVTAHSAGSIWASRMLLTMQAAGVQRKVNLLLLAPAVRHNLFAETINKAGHLIEQCRMYTMSDELERRDAVLGHDWGFIYPGSLLYLVSGLCEEYDDKSYPDAPLLGMQRFFAAPWLNEREQAEMQAISEFFRQSGNDIIFSPEPGVCLADCHGCFDNEALTLKSAIALF